MGICEVHLKKESKLFSEWETPCPLRSSVRPTAPWTSTLYSRSCGKTPILTEFIIRIAFQISYLVFCSGDQIRRANFVILRVRSGINLFVSIHFEWDHPPPLAKLVTQSTPNSLKIICVLSTLENISDRSKFPAKNYAIEWRLFTAISRMLHVWALHLHPPIQMPKRSMVHVLRGL